MLINKSRTSYNKKGKIVCELIEYCEKLNILFIDKTNAMAIVTKKGHCEMCIMTKKKKVMAKGLQIN